MHSTITEGADTDVEHPANATIEHMVEHAAHVLPSQGAITAFVHHNTLHAFEDLPFDEAVRKGSEWFGCHPYFPEQRYRREYASGRIRREDLVAVLLNDLQERANQQIGHLGNRFHLRMAMLEFPLPLGPVHELRWIVEETDALQRFRPETTAVVRNRVVAETRHWVMRDLRSGHSGEAPAAADERAMQIVNSILEVFRQPEIETWNDETWEAFTLHLLWLICSDGADHANDHPVVVRPTLRHRDSLLQATGEDTDRLVDEVLIRFCSAFLDQGFADWPLPEREQGLYRSFIELYRRPVGPPAHWMRGLELELERLHRDEVDAATSIQESLLILGISQNAQQDFITQTLLALRGFAGMLWQMETRGDRVQYPAPAGSLLQFLAIRLILERFAINHMARQTLGLTVPLSELRQAVEAKRKPSAESLSSQRAFTVFQVAQALGWRPQDLHRLSGQEWSQLFAEIEDFSGIERRQIYQAAYERRYNVGLLDAITVHTQRTSPPTSTADFQLTCCIDDREESFRRHLEEIAANCETFGFAGFYAVAMYYRGAGDAYHLPLCPVTIKPKHYVHEEVSYAFAGTHRRRAEVRRALGTASHRLHLGSRTFLGGILTGALGAIVSVPLVMRVLMPRLTSQIRRMFGRFIRTPAVTQLTLERTQPDPGPDNGHLGYSVPEMAEIVERVLRDIGLTSRFSRLIIFTGHGSSSLNNPHESAYNCGACAGGRGGPNARAFAQMANDQRIRSILKEHGLHIPDTTVFVGAYHNTCDDSVDFFDLERLPSSHRDDLDYACRCIDEARQRNAHERCRRFESASLTMTPEEALRHVEARAEDLSQARPEYNHATNAVTIVGRRWRFRGLFLDRRAFLSSYDPLQDDEDCTILERILQPAVPVCAGISLEYYFSCVDPEGWGCGSKLPHNVTSLLGVMSGAASDLRPGLSQQMVEIHEPVRQVFVVETTPAAMKRIMTDNEGIRRLVVNEWVYLVTLDPHSSTMHIFRDGDFELYDPESNELPLASSSQDWYRGWRDNLGFASIGVDVSDSEQPVAAVQPEGHTL